MNCTRMAPKTHWISVGYGAAKRGLTFESIRVPGEERFHEIRSPWIDGPSVNIDTGETQWSHVRVLSNGFRDFVAGFLRAIRLPIWNN